MKKALLLMLTIGFTIAITACFSDSNDKENRGNNIEQVELGSKLVEVIEKDGFSFKDLNKNGVLDGYEDWRLSPEERAENLVSLMTLEEKAGALLHINTWGDGSDITSITEKFAGSGVTRLSNDPVEFSEAMNSLQEAAESTRLGVPFAVSSDPRHHEGGGQYGVSLVQKGLTMWPQPIGFGAIAAGDEGAGVEITEKAGEVIKDEYRAMGIHIALHPQIDLLTEPRWGRISGNFSTENADLTGKLGAAYIRGLQGDGLSSETVSAMAKHFSGGGPQEYGIDAHLEEGKNQAYPGNNFDYHVLPFNDAIFEGVEAIMPYYGVPVGQTSEDVGMSFNKEIITNLLKEELGFTGIICTDWGIINDPQSRDGFMGMSWGVEDLTMAERVAKALEAGVDQFGGLDDPAPIIDAVNEGLVTESRLDPSIKKIIINKIELGLFENPYVDLTNLMSLLGNDQDDADEAQLKSTVLLQNRGSALPVSSVKADTKIFIYGKTALEVSELGVTGVDTAMEADVAIVRVVAPYSIVPDGMVSMANGAIFNMHGGPLSYGPYEGEGGELSKYHIYADGVQVTETQDYKAVNYSDLEHINEVVENKGENTKVIVDVFMERPAILGEFIESVDVIFASFGISDKNLLSLVFGASSPSGKLPFALPSSMVVVENQKEDLPSYEETDIYGEDNPFPYGFGLTYDSNTTEKFNLTINENETVTVVVKDKETGNIVSGGMLEGNKAYTVTVTANAGYILDAGYYSKPSPFGDFNDYISQFGDRSEVTFDVAVDMDRELGGYALTEEALSGFTEYLDVAYAQSAEKSLVYDVYKPENASNTPVVFIIHGGGWVSGDEDVMRGMARQIVKTENYVVVALTYRFLGMADGGTIYNEMPELIEDCYGAIAHFMENADLYGADIKRFGITGDSAGGHLCSSVSTMSDMIGTEGFKSDPFTTEYWPTGLEESEVTEFKTAFQTGLKAFAPSYARNKVYASSESIDRYGNPNVSTAFEAAEDQINSNFHKALSPIEAVDGSTLKVPVWQSRGAEDFLISAESLNEFDTALKDAGYPYTEVVTVEGANHAFYDWKPDPNNQYIFIEYGKPFIEQMVSFFDKYVLVSFD